MNLQGNELKPRALTWTERDALIKAGSRLRVLSSRC